MSDRAEDEDGEEDEKYLSGKAEPPRAGDEGPHNGCPEDPGEDKSHDCGDQPGNAEQG